MPLCCEETGVSNDLPERLSEAVRVKIHNICLCAIVDVQTAAETEESDWGLYRLHGCMLMSCYLPSTGHTLLVSQPLPDCNS